MLQSHEIDYNKKEQVERNRELQYQAFKYDAVSRITRCFEGNGDLVDLINDLDLEFDDYDSLTNSEINEIVIEGAFKNYSVQEQTLENIDGEILHEYLRASGYIFNKA